MTGGKENKNTNINGNFQIIIESPSANKEVQLDTCMKPISLPNCTNNRLKCTPIFQPILKRY